MNRQYEEAVAYIEETPKFTTKNSLEHTRECLRRLGNPQNRFRVIHVAGTNGKGSTCAFITSVLREAGHSCGLFTSPHLVEINERFQINEEVIDNGTFMWAFRKVKDLADHLVEEGSYHPTYFEFLFLMGMVIFAEAGVEYVTLETGLGGRLDATTSIENPLICVITSVSLDHQQYLGETVAEIAGEKAGILVPGVPVIFDGNAQDAAAVIERTAKEKGCPFVRVQKEDCEILNCTPDGIDFSVKSKQEKFHIPFVAKYQVMNAALALKTLEILKEEIPYTKNQLLKGLAETRWQGRMETVLPSVIVDGAHNEDGVARFVETAAHFQKDYEITLLFSAVADKDYKGMIANICKEFSPKKVITTQIDGYRVVPAEQLAAIFEEHGVEAEGIQNIEQAFDRAMEVKEEGLLFCVGSLYLVGEIKSIIRRRIHD